MMTKAERLALAKERIAHRKQLKTGIVEVKEEPVKKPTKSKKTAKAEVVTETVEAVEEPVVEQ